MKLSQIQQKLKAPKGQLNKFGNYKYRSAEDILEAVKPLLNGESTIILSDELVMIGDRYYVKATATFKGEETETVTAYAREEEIKKGMDSSQITGSASSYARKYALNGLLLIDDTKDADATNQHENDLPDRLKGELSKYTDPQTLEKDKITLRDKYVKLGMAKKEATDMIMETLNAF